MPYVIGPNGEHQWVMPPEELRPQETLAPIPPWLRDSLGIKAEGYFKQKEDKMEGQETQENKIKTIKKRCAICGKTVKRVITKELDNTPQYFGMIEYPNNGKIDTICQNCEDRYHITKDYFARGYGYQGSTRPRMTSADKFSTPTYGVEIEVAGNIKNIDKIASLVYQNYECTIGYDTSVEGAQFEFSYAPGTYYWYLHESKLRAVCKLLQNDKWVKKDSPTTGMHIHIGRIDKPRFLKALLLEQSYDHDAFWALLRILAERDFNQYCRDRIGSDHHYAISASRKWGTVEFRMFRQTLDFDTIMNRIKFIRQLVDNATPDGINWENIRQDSKQWFVKLINKSRLSREIKEMVNGLLEKPLDERLKKIDEQTRSYMQESAYDAVEMMTRDDDYENEEYEEEHEEEGW